MERWDEVLLDQGEVLIMVSTARHHAPPPRPRHARGLVHSVDPDEKHANVLPNATHLDPPTDPLLKKILGTLEH